MRVISLTAACCLATTATASFGQTAQTVDPETGNYVAARDALLRSDPDPNSDNPNRLGNRLSPRNSRTTAPAAARSAPLPGHAAESDGLTPAQRAASRAAYNGRGLPMGMPTHDGSTEAVTSDGYMSLGNMAVFDTVETSSGVPQKPDWWPKN